MNVILDPFQVSQNLKFIQMRTEPVHVPYIKITQLTAANNYDMMHLYSIYIYIK